MYFDTIKIDELRLYSKPKYKSKREKVVRVEKKCSYCLDGKHKACSSSFCNCGCPTSVANKPRI